MEWCAQNEGDILMSNQLYFNKVIKALSPFPSPLEAGGGC